MCVLSSMTIGPEMNKYNSLAVGPGNGETRTYVYSPGVAAMRHVRPAASPHDATALLLLLQLMVLL